MALNFGVLDQGGPSNFFEGYSQGQEKMQANAMAQQKADQAQQEFGMRQQEFAAGQADKRRVADSAIVTQRTIAARDALLRARTPDEARVIVRAQHADPYLGRIRQQFGTLEQDLAEVPDEPTAFQQYKEREAMGAEAFLKQQASSREFSSAMGGAQAIPQAAPTNAMAPAGVAAPAAPANAMVAPAMSEELKNFMGQRERLTSLADQNPRVKATIDRLDKEISRLSPAAPTPPASIAEFERAKTDPGFMRFLQERAAAIRPPAAPRAEQPPVAVIDPVTGKQVFVSREEALSGRMTPAAAMESLPPKEIQKREAALPQATSSVKGFESKSDKFIADLKALRDDPGLENITGPIFGRTGSVSQAGSRAQALYDKVVAKGGFQALQDLRDASKTGGALGNVSNAEGKQLIASFSAIDRRQNAEDVRAAIDQAISDIEGSKTRMREAYDSTYSYKSGGSATPATALGKLAATLSTADKQALDWANSNPKDPRALQIKQRLGQ